MRFCCDGRSLEFTRVGIVTTNTVRSSISEIESLIDVLVFG